MLDDSIQEGVKFGRLAGYIEVEEPSLVVICIEEIHFDRLGYIPNFEYCHSASLKFLEACYRAFVSKCQFRPHLRKVTDELLFLINFKHICSQILKLD